jgi:aspartyl-tRNA(Asn)/glutamyl-tRNA(Gln) amidotransferase subunit A
MNRAVKSLRLGVPRELFFENLDPEVESSMAAALQQLSKLTAGPRPVKLPSLPRFRELPFFYEAYVQIISAESYAFHEKMLKQSPELYHPQTRKSLENGAAVTAAAYIDARRAMDRLRADSKALFQEADLLISPAAPIPAFPLGKPAGLIALCNAAPWNLYGLPSISVPCGFTKAGLPVGLQITGPHGEDRLVLALAHAYQQSTDWHLRRPPV